MYIIQVDTKSFAGLLKEDQGSKVIFVPGYELPLMLVKSDGAFTYDTSDMTALKHRVMVEKGDWLIYVVDSGQVCIWKCTIFSAIKILCLVGYTLSVDLRGCQDSWLL